MTSAGPEIVSRLLVGNLLLAILFTVVAYVVGYRFTVEYRRRADDGGLSVLERFYERAVAWLPGGTEPVAPTDASTDAATDGGQADRPASDRARD